MIYKGDYLNEISFPLGGIGTGCIGLAGNGSLIDWEIFNRPNKESFNSYTFFAVRAEYPDGHAVSKVLQGDHTKNLKGQHSDVCFTGVGFGPNSDTMCGFPHFRNVEFDGRFPIACLTFSDDDFPAEIIMEAYNPFIPHDSEDSSIPAAVFTIKIKSLLDDIKYSVVLSLKNPFEKTQNFNASSDGITAIQMKYADKDISEKEYGDITIATSAENAFTHTYWYRGMWRDNVETFWHEFTTGTLLLREYGDASIGDVGSVGCTLKLGKDKTDRVTFAISWNVPNCYNYWTDREDIKNILWKNYYATRFGDSIASAFYILKNHDNLFGKTEIFCNSLHSSTLDPAVIDAISSTLSVLKSPTVLRLEDGTFYAWEGVHEKMGSCEGTCTHVWSYVYALSFLFPDLERTIRETEFINDTDEVGKMSFRTLLPIGSGVIPFHPCVDGQMASVIKAYREWKISGDNEWLKKYWQTVKKLLEYAWSDKNPDEWDKNGDGILEGRQHHTLDMELFGPSSWLEGMYIAALNAAAEMADFIGDTESSEKYRRLSENGYNYTKNHLFNGRYFIHKVDLTDRSYTEHFNCPEYWNEEKGQLKYQIGEGCEIDQVLAQWHSNICGLGEIYDKQQLNIALENMYKYIYKPTLRDFPNAWRIFALNDEGGAVMCSYPDDVERPIIPLLYNEECMTGFEYSFAGLLISEGHIEKGLNIVRSIRDRYDGKKRNPWNEIECGSNYARSMASYALLPIFSGFEFDLPKGHIGFSPILSGDFRCLWSLGHAWGDFIRTDGSAKIILNGGYIELSSLTLGKVDTITSLLIDGKNINFINEKNTVYFDKTVVKEVIEVFI